MGLLAGLEDATISVVVGGLAAGDVDGRVADTSTHALIRCEGRLL